MRPPAARPHCAALRRRALASMPNGVPMASMRGSYHHEPMWVAQASGARFTDVDGFSYADFNIADIRNSRVGLACSSGSTPRPPRRPTSKPFASRASPPVVKRYCSPGTGALLRRQADDELAVRGRAAQLEAVTVREVGRFIPHAHDIDCRRRWQHRRDSQISREV